MKTTVIYPRLSDPRLLIILFFFSFISYALLTPGFARSQWQFAIASGTCIVLDLVFGYIKTKKIIVPLSGFVSSFGIFLLIDSSFVWPYFLCAILTVGSKHLLTYKDRHIFNPNNFGAVICSLAFPYDLVIAPHRWGGSVYLSLFIFVLGFIIAYRVRRHYIAISYLAFFLLAVFLRSIIFSKNFLSVVVPLVGASTQLFTFYMITDPKTSPVKPWRQVTLGACIAFLDNVFRHMEIKNSAFYALFIILFIYQVFLIEKVPDKSWQTAQV